MFEKIQLKCFSIMVTLGTVIIAQPAVSPRYYCFDSLVANDGFDPTQRELVVLDFDGDGHSDFIIHHDSGELERYQSNEMGYVKLNEMVIPGFNPNVRKLYVMDIDGLHGSDFIIFNDNGTINKYLADGAGGFISSSQNIGIPYNPADKELVILDFNGDGKSDFLIHHDGGTLQKFESDGTGFNLLGEMAVPGFNPNVRNTYVSYIDSNSNADFFIYDNSGILHLYLSNGMGEFSSISQFIGIPYNPVDKELVVLDFNGDGKSDFLIHHDGGTLQKFISNGTGFTFSGDMVVPGFNPALRKLYIANVDGNNLTDFIIYGSSQDHGVIEKYISNGSGFVGRSQTIPAPYNPADKQLSMLDIDGDLKSDFLLYHDGKTVQEYFAKQFPVWSEDMQFLQGPVITVNSLGIPGYEFVADPYLLPWGTQMACFFEAKKPTENGEIWMCSCSNGSFPQWNSFRKVSVDASHHFSHPEALIVGENVYVLYNYSPNLGENDYTCIYLRKCPLSTLFSQSGPQWSDELRFYHVPIERHLVEFTLFERNGRWNMLDIMRKGIVDDQLIYGKRRNGFPTNPVEDEWNISSYNIVPPGNDTPYVLMDVINYSWMKSYVEITSIKADSMLLMLMGTTKQDDQRSISAFAVTKLTDSSFEGRWLNDGFTVDLAATPWCNDSHRGHVVFFDNKWIYVYDGRYKVGEQIIQDWAIGFATIQ